MTQATRFLYLLTLGIWIGSIVFFSFVVAPTVFKVLKPDDAGMLIRRIFSKYYLLGMICAVAGIVCVGILLADRQFTKWPAILSLVLLAGMGGCDLWMRQSVSPYMNELRDKVATIKAAGKEPEPELDKEWKALHRLSVQVNAVVLLCGLVLLGLVVYGRAVT